MSEQNILSVYNQLSQHYEMPEFEEFKDSLASNEQHLKTVHRTLESLYSKVPSFEEFSDSMSILDDNNTLPQQPNSNDINTSDGKINTIDNTNTNPITSDDMVQDIDVDATDLLDKKLQEEREEEEFLKWYSQMSDLTGIDQDPDHPDHKYDYRAAFKAGVEPEQINGDYKSTDWGLFQINDKYWKDDPNGPSYKDNIDANINMAKNIYNATGFDSWVTYKNYHKSIKKGEEPKGGAAEYGKAYETLGSLYAQNPQEFLNNPELVVDAMNSLSQSNNFTVDNYRKVFNAFYTGKDDTTPKDQKDADIAANKLITSLSVVHAESFGNPNAKNDNYDKIWKWDSQFKHDDHDARWEVKAYDGDDYIHDTKNGMAAKVSDIKAEMIKTYNLSDDEIAEWERILHESGAMAAETFMLETAKSKLWFGQPLGKQYDNPDMADPLYFWKMLYRTSHDVVKSSAQIGQGLGHFARYTVTENIPNLIKGAWTGTDPWKEGNARTLEEYMEFVNSEGGWDWLENSTYAGDAFLHLFGYPFQKYEEHAVQGMKDFVSKETESVMWGRATETGMRILPFAAILKGKYNRHYKAKHGYAPTLSTKGLWNKVSKDIRVYDASFPSVQIRFGDFNKIYKGLGAKDRSAFINKLSESFGMKKSEILKKINDNSVVEVNWSRYVYTFDKPWLKNFKKKFGIKSDYDLGVRISNKNLNKVKNEGVVMDGEVLFPKYDNAVQVVNNRASRTLATNNTISNALNVKNTPLGSQKPVVQTPPPPKPIGQGSSVPFIPIQANTLLGISKTLEVPPTIYHGSGGKVTPLNLTGQERVLFGGDNPMALIEQLKGQGVKGADKIKTWEDANKFISETYKNDYDLIQFNNSSRPQLGNEYIQTSSGKSFAAEEAHAEVYAKSTGRKEKYKEPVKTKPVKQTTKEYLQSKVEKPGERRKPQTIKHIKLGEGITREQHIESKKSREATYFPQKQGIMGSDLGFGNKDIVVYGNVPELRAVPIKTNQKDAYRVQSAIWDNNPKTYNDKGQLDKTLGKVVYTISKNKNMTSKTDPTYTVKDLINLEIDKSARNSGVGKKVVDLIKSTGKDNKHDIIVRDIKKDAVVFWEKQGVVFDKNVKKNANSRDGILKIDGATQVAEFVNGKPLWVKNPAGYVEHIPNAKPSKKEIKRVTVQKAKNKSELPEGVKLTNNKFTIVKRTDAGPIQGIKIKGKDYFAQQLPTGSGGKLEWRQVDLDGNVIGDVLGKNKKAARNKLIKMSREGQAKKPAPVKKELTKAQKEGRLEKIKAKAKIQKELDKVIPGRDKIKLYDKNIDILTKRIQKLESMPPSKARDAAINKAQLQRDAQYTHRDKYKEIIKESASYLESAVKTKVNKENTIKRLKNEAKKNPNDVGLKNELNTHKRDLARLNVVIEKLAPYKLALKYPEMAVYSTIGPLLPPGTVRFIKDIFKIAKAKLGASKLSSRDIKVIFDAITGRNMDSYKMPVNLNEKGNIAKTVDNLLTDASRWRDLKIYEALETSKSWYKKYPDVSLREDVGAAKENIGNIKHKGDTYADVMSRFTPKHREFLKDLSIGLESQRRMVNNWFEKQGLGEQIAFLERYLPHLYNLNTKRKIDAFTARWKKKNMHTKKRTFPTLQEAIDAGYKPLTQDGAVLYDKWVALNWNIAATNKMVLALRNTNWVDGKPIIRRKPPAEFIKNQNWLSSDNVAFSDIGSKIWYPEEITGAIRHMEGSKSLTLPKFNEPFFDMLLSNRQPLRALEQLNLTLKALQLTLNPIPWMNFHAGALIESNYGHILKNPIKYIKKPSDLVPVISLGLKNPSGKWIWDHADALMKDKDFRKTVFMSGLQLDKPMDYQYHKVIGPLVQVQNKIISMGLSKHFNLPFKAIQALINKQDKYLWQQLHRGLKITNFSNLYNQFLKDFPNEHPKILSERAAEIINNNFGGQELVNKTFMKHPLFKKIMQNMWLSYDWTFSNIRNPLDYTGLTGAFRRTAGGQPNFKNYGQKFQLFNMFKVALFGLAGQQIFQTVSNALEPDDPNNRDTVFENENIKGYSLTGFPSISQDHRFDGDITHLYRLSSNLLRKAFGMQVKTDADWGDQRYYIKMGKQQKEIINWLSNPGQAFYGKTSPLMHMLVENILGNTSLFEDEYTSKMTKTMKYGIPNSGVKTWFKGFVELATPFWAKPDTKNFMTMFPVKTGATFNKTRESFQRHLILWANDNMMNKLGEEGYITKQDFYNKFPEIIDAAERNGIDWRNAAKQAIANVSYASQQLAIEAILDGDIESAKEYTSRAIKLGVSLKQFKDKLKKNGKISELEYEELDKMFNELETHNIYLDLKERGFID